MEIEIEALEGRGPRVTATALPRRAVLRGAGVALALPWLEAMTSASASAAESTLGSTSGSTLGSASGPGAPGPPRRLLYVYSPNGINMKEWRQAIPPVTPDSVTAPQVGAWPIEVLPSLLEPLAPWSSSLQILRGLTQDKARAHGDGGGDHARAAGAYLTGIQPLKTEGRVRLGVSADQIAARAIGGDTRIRALTLGLEYGRQSGQCDSGYACAYQGHISWESETTPASKEVVPRRAFDRLFRGGDAGRSPQARRAQTAERRSVLDFVRGEAARLGKSLGAQDRARLDEYATGLRELERRLAFPNAAHVEEVGDEQRPGGVPSTFREHAAVLGDVIAFALMTDVTRVVTLMLGNEGSERRYTEVGVNNGHHSISHHGGDEAKLASILAINRLHIEAFAHLVGRLAEAREGEGSVLDSSMALYGSGIADGNRHDHHDLPLVLVGGAATGLLGGRTVAYDRDTPLNDLHLALLDRVGVQGAALGDGRGLLPGI